MTLLIRPILITLNRGDITHNDITFKINEGNMRYVFFAVVSKVI
jgi:hypothetical protein